MAILCQRVSTPPSKTTIVLPAQLPASDRLDAPGKASDNARAAGAAQFSHHFDWVICDSEATVNFGAGVSTGALAELRSWATLSLAALDSSQVRAFLL